MNNVNNRKMFRKSKAARDKLRNIGGIMASDVELMNTVAKYNTGGSVSGRLPLITGHVFPAGPRGQMRRFSGGRNPNYGMINFGLGLRGFQPNISASDFMSLPAPEQRKLIEAENRRRAIQRASAGAQLAPRGIADLLTGSGAGLVNLITSGAQGIGLLDPRGKPPLSGTNLTSRGVDLMKSFPEITGTPEEQRDQYAALLATDRGEFQDPNIARAVKEQEARDQAIQKIGGDITAQFPSKGSRSEPSSMYTDLGGEEAEMGAGFVDTRDTRGTRGGDGAARDKGLAPMAATDSKTIADKKGENGPEAQVTAIVNNGTKEEQEQSLKNLMAEFTQNAPEYEGVDKGLAIAKIGFAMAAGQSDSAITNIATALSDGADMFIKDKKDRDAFDRQIQLSALQYGLGEQGKIRAQKRADERNIMKFVNDDDEIVGVSIADYIKNGHKIPEGLRSIEMYTSDQKAIVEKAKAFRESVEEQIKAKRLDRKDVRKDTENYSKFVDIASQAENTAFVLETVLKANADGQLSGALNAAKTGAAKVGAFLGIDVPESFSNKSVAITQLKGALQGVIKVTLAGTQSANSISNRDVDLLIQGFLADGVMNADSNGVLTFATTDENVINASLQNGLRAVRDAQAKALNQMTAIEKGLVGLITPQGDPASTILDPFRNTDVGSRARRGESRTLGYNKETDTYSAIDFGG